MAFHEFRFDECSIRAHLHENEPRKVYKDYITRASNSNFYEVLWLEPHLLVH